MNNKVSDLPQSNDEFWDGEKYPVNPVRMAICATHGKDWQEHRGYNDNHDGTVSCQYCGWGCFLPGYMKVYKGRIFDLRSR